MPRLWPDANPRAAVSHLPRHIDKAMSNALGCASEAERIVSFLALSGARLFGGKTSASLRSGTWSIASSPSFFLRIRTRRRGNVTLDRVRAAVPRRHGRTMADRFSCRSRRCPGPPRSSHVRAHGGSRTRRPTAIQDEPHEFRVMPHLHSNACRARSSACCHRDGPERRAAQLFMRSYFLNSSRR
jgi:hypothetical protein